MLEKVLEHALEDILKNQNTTLHTQPPATERKKGTGGNCQDVEGNRTQIKQEDMIFPLLVYLTIAAVQQIDSSIKRI